ncbi:MAG: hypothetical protein ACYC1L_10960 [Alphaproteobacteria bacterium]
MVDALQQINIRHEATEDRLLLRLRTSAEGETSLYLTRRFVARLWPALVKTLGADPAVAAQADPVARGAVMAFRHEHAVSRSDFSRPYRPPAAKPAVPPPSSAARDQGDEPAEIGEKPEAADPDAPQPLEVKGELVALCQIQTPGQERVMLTFKTTEKKAVTVNLSIDMLHGFCKLLQQAADKAEWGLVLTLPGGGAAGPKAAAPVTVN